MGYEPDTTYFARRAQREREMAERAAEASVALVHRRLAELYDAKTRASKPTLRLVPAM